MWRVEAPIRLLGQPCTAHQQAARPAPEVTPSEYDQPEFAPTTRPLGAESNSLLEAGACSLAANHPVEAVVRSHLEFAPAPG
jgi:hypothetical protein